MNFVPAWWAKPRTISIVVDNDSWVLPYAQTLIEILNREGDQAILAREHEGVQNGAVAFYLGCIKITPPEILARNKRNLVIHASDLPKGRGFSPLVWEILKGENRIPVCLIEAAKDVDAGAIIYREELQYDGSELSGELRAVLGEMHVVLCHRFMNAVTPASGVPQTGPGTRYPRRTVADSRVDPQKSIAAQFDLLRVVDNVRYPAFFDFRGHRYLLKIEKAPEGYAR